MFSVGVNVPAERPGVSVALIGLLPPARSRCWFLQKIFHLRVCSWFVLIVSAAVSGLAGVVTGVVVPVQVCCRVGGRPGEVGGRPGEVGGVAGRVATAEAVAAIEGGAVALVESEGVELAQLQTVTSSGSVPGGHLSLSLTRDPDTGHSRRRNGRELPGSVSSQVQTSIETH